MTKNFSVVITILNEEKTIESLLSSLFTQSLQSTEVIIVDGGSTDSSVKIIKKLQKKYSHLHLFLHPGSNRSQSRNCGIFRSQNELIVVTDAGCIPKRDWLEKITSPFFEDVGADVVAGYYDANPQSYWQHVSAEFLTISPDNFQEKTFLPSSRSLAFKKSLWKKVGGYPENLDTCEDLIFAEKLKTESKCWIVKKDALVIWTQPDSLAEIRDKIYHYALGDLQAGYERHVQKIKSAVWRIVILIGVAFPLFFTSIVWLRFLGIGLFALYALGSIVKHRRLLRFPQSFVLLLLIQLSIDTSLLQAWIFSLMNKKV